MAGGGGVYWITGLSGAGKTTLAEALVRRLRADDAATVLLDGDAMRELFADRMPQGHGRADRLALSWGYSRLCRFLAGQGVTVVCATMSLFHEIQRWNRATIPGYREIWLRVPLDELERRDPKGIYGRARAGAARDVVGIDLAAEFPQAPDLVIDNHGSCAPDEALERIWRTLVTADHG